MPAVADPPAPKAASNATEKYTHGLGGVDLQLDSAMSRTLWITISILLLIVLFGRVGQMLNAHLRKLMNLSGSTHSSYWENDRTRIWPWLKRQVLYAPLRNKRHNKEFMLSSALNVGTLPSRLHTAILVIYFISNCVYCCWLDYSKEQRATLAELRGRTGHLSMVNMVPLIVLAGRNNPLIYLLRVSFDTYNLFHRWIGRLVALEAVIHTIAWACNQHAANGAGSVAVAIRMRAFYGWGLVGTLAMCLIMIQSPSIVRHAFYETFLHCHQVLALCAIIGVWVHCDTGHLPHSSYIRWAFALWMLDRSARLARIIYFSVHKNGAFSRITVEALPGDGTLEACRVTVHVARPWTYTPGTHAYIYLPTISFWMNHPFSIAWSSPSPIEALALEEKDSSGNSFLSRSSSRATTDTALTKNTTHSTISKLTTAPLATPASKQQTPSTQFHFILAKRTGMTASLYDKALAAPNRTLSLPGLFEGPYAGNDALHSYGTLLLFAAGVGITHQIGHVRDLLHAHAAGVSATQKIILVWSVKNTETLEWVRPWMDEIFAMPNRKLVLRVELYVTRPRSRREVVSRSETVRMFPGRCEPGLVVGRVMRERKGAVAVTVCGPGAFGDEVRAAVRGQGLGGEGKGGTVDFVEEGFSW